MIDHNKHVFHQLTKYGGDVRKHGSLSFFANDIQSHIRDIGHLPGRFADAQHVEAHVSRMLTSLAPSFEEAFGVDLRALPDDVAKMLLYFAITATLPGTDPYPQGHGGMSASTDARERRVAIGFMLLQTGRDPELGLETLSEVADLIKRA